MDMIENLAKQASQITMYDIKSYYNSAKNMVLNIPEMEAKVREATNEDPWGASSTLMQEIAQGTHNFQHFNEIMPTIYSRFMEKEAREWRQIYKALTLLEYLIKHGSERVVDDARAHISTIKMLRNFHYIDEKGKDQGINVRNRANEIASLLSDVDRIRAERRKAKSNRNKYQGVEGGMFNTASGSRYGGFGSDTYRGSGGSDSWGRDDEYRGSSGRASGGGFRDSSRQPEYDEYEGADDFDERPARASPAAAAPSRSQRSSANASPPKPPKEAPQPKKEVNLFDFDDDEPAAPAASAPAPAAAAPIDAFGDDDFDDFQQAPAAPAPAPAAAAAAPSGGANANLFALLEGGAPKPTPAAAPAAAPTRAPQQQTFSAVNPPAYGMGMGMGGMAAQRPAQPQLQPQTQRVPSPTKPAAQAPPKPKPTTSTFDDLWATSLGAPVLKPSASGKKTIAEMEKEKNMNSLWGQPAAAPAASSGFQQPSQPAKPAGGSSSAFDDLLL